MYIVLVLAAVGNFKLMIDGSMHRIMESAPNVSYKQHWAKSPARNIKRTFTIFGYLLIDFGINISVCLFIEMILPI